MEIKLPLSDEERAVIQEETTEDYLAAEKRNSKGLAGIDLSKITCPIQRKNTLDHLNAVRRNHVAPIGKGKMVSGTVSERK